MNASQLKKYFALLAVILFLPSLSACPQSEGEEASPPDEPVPASEIPLRSTPGLCLVYTVNDPRAAAIGIDRNAHVLIAKPDGSQREVLFSFPGFIFHTVPSPRGTHIAFVGSARGETGQEERHLFIYDFRSDSYADVSATGFYSRAVKTAPLFTPDGEWILFLSRWSVESGEYNIFKCETSSGRIAGLYTDPTEDVPLELVPDGSRCLAVRRIPDTPGEFEYISLDIDSGSIDVLHKFYNLTKVGPAKMDQSGTMIYCDIKPWEEGEGISGGIRSRDVIALDLTDGSVTNLLDPLTVTYVYQIFSDSEGRNRLLLRRQEESAGEETPLGRIATCLTDGSDFQYLTDTSIRSYLLGPPPTNIRHLSPDNSLLFFYRQDPLFEHEDIWVMKPDGTDPVNISNTAGYNEGSAGWIVIPPS